MWDSSSGAAFLGVAAFALVTNAIFIGADIKADMAHPLVPHHHDLLKFGSTATSVQSLAERPAFQMSLST